MFKKKNTAIYILLFFLALFGSSCKPRIIRRTRRVKDTSLARVKINRRIVVGIRGKYLPFSNTVQNNYSGFDVEIAREVAKELNVQIEFRPLSWQETARSLEDGTVDCLWSAFDPSDFSNKKFIFSDPYIKSTQTIFLPRESIHTSLESLKNRDIGFLSMGDSLINAGVKDTALRDFPNVKIYHDLELAIDDVYRKKIDVIIGDIFVLNNRVSLGENIMMLNEPIKQSAYSVVFKGTDESLRNKINEVLIKLEYDGVLEEISRKWFNTNMIIIGK
ncbi:MAG: transporter substrate-binding domain-containing protein [Treponemataceae bacterium]